MSGGGMTLGGLNSGLNANMNSDIAEQISLLSVAGRPHAASVGGQQQPVNRPMGMAPPMPPNVPDKRQVQFLAILSQVLLNKDIILPPFITGQPNPAWNPNAGPLKYVQPATDNRPGALRLPGAAPGEAGNIDLFRLWGVVTGAGGMRRISSIGQWGNVAAHIGLQLPVPLPGSTYPPAAQLAQLYFMLFSPLEEYMEQCLARVKYWQTHLQVLVAPQQQQQNPGQVYQQPPLTPAQLHQQQNPSPGGMQNHALGFQNNLGGMQNALGGMQGPDMGRMQNTLGMNTVNVINPVAAGQVQKTPGPIINATENIESAPQKPPITPDGHWSIQSSPGTVTISSLMSASGIAIHLGEHGCENITDHLDMSSCSKYPISSGGFGDVYRAMLYDGTSVAVKTMRLQVGPSERDQKPLKHAARELHTWSKCRHPNVVRLLGLVELRGQIGMVSLWMDNGNLHSYLDKHHDADRCQMSLQISEGLGYLHRSGIIHGDLKGANVLISNEGIPMLVDFGNAILQERTLQFTYTTIKTSHSPRWAAPEIIEGSGTYSFAADVYALGMTILETITGRVPYYGKSDHAVYFTVAMKREHPKRPDGDIPPDNQHGNILWSVLTRCWAYEAGARPHVGDIVNIMKTITREGLQEDSVAQWTQIPSTPPSQPLTITLPVTLNHAEQPYTFNLDFDMPMATYAGDPDAHVAHSLANVSLENNQGLLAVPGLNDLLEAPLPDIAVSFAEGQEGGFDILSGEDEEWWVALVGAAFVGKEQRYEAGPSQAGSSHAGLSHTPSHAGPSHAGPSNHASNHAGPSQEQVVSQLGPDSPVPTSRPPHSTLVHTQPLQTFSHDLARPGETSHSRLIPDGHSVEEEIYQDSYPSKIHDLNAYPSSGKRSHSPEASTSRKSRARQTG